MKQNINKNSSDREKFTRADLADSVQKNSSQTDAITQKNKELQLQARYLYRVLEAYGDCV